MKYTAPDGYVIKSDPNQPVTYTLPCNWMSEGIYESFETMSAATDVGIQQIKIVRTVQDKTMTITVTESTKTELLDYINKLKQK